MDNPPSTKDPICSREDVSADISAGGQSFAPAGMKASLVYVCNLCRPEMTPFRNINVLENLGSLVGTQENYICFYWVCFTLKSFVGDREPCQSVQCHPLSVWKGPLSNRRAVCRLKRFICWIRGPL